MWKSGSAVFTSTFRSLISRALKSVAGWVGPAEYAPWFFSLRLIELAEDPMPEVGLTGTAALTARKWFDIHVDRVRGHLKPDDGLTLDERIAIVRDWLRSAAGPSGYPAPRTPDSD